MPPSLICAIVFITPTIVSAERNLIPTLDNQRDLCPE